MEHRYPDEIGIVLFKDGTFDVYPDLADIPPSVKYIRADRVQQYLGIGKVVEESGELLQILGKLIAFPNNEHPDGKGDLLIRASDEFADVKAANQYFVHVNGLDENYINKRSVTKFNQFMKWVLTGLKR